MAHSTRAGAGIYSPLTLKLYDAWVLGLSNRFAWHCPTREVLQPFFNRHLGRRHLDVGVGTGYYLAHAGLQPHTRLTLMDLNPHSLAAARQRIGRADTEIVRHDVLTPLPAVQPEALYDSISLFYLLHCLPGPMSYKARALGHLKTRLAPHGTLFGATILGDSAGHRGFGRALMAIYNRKGIFGNRTDTRQQLHEALSRHFAQVTLEVHGQVALFTARQPIGGDDAAAGE